LDNNTLIAIINILTFIVPITLVGIGAMAYDQWHRRKTRIGDNYQCSHCGFSFPQKTATISGWESHPYGLHINCPQCGATVDQFVKVKNVST
jgi:predicted RNA-binding Zn-ribbon protein involved in translation (DUF1610 family)